MENWRAKRISGTSRRRGIDGRMLQACSDQDYRHHPRHAHSVFSSVLVLGLPCTGGHCADTRAFSVKVERVAFPLCVLQLAEG